MKRRRSSQKLKPQDDDILIDYPDKHVLKLYRQVRGWKFRTTLSRKQMALVKSLLETHYPTIDEEVKRLRTATWIGIAQGIGILLILGALLLFIFGG